MYKLVILFILGLLSCHTVTDSEEDLNHYCKFPACIFQGLGPEECMEVLLKSNDVGSDYYHIEELHLMYPDKLYEELEDSLFMIKTEVL